MQPPGPSQREPLSFPSQGPSLTHGLCGNGNRSAFRSVAQHAYHDQDQAYPATALHCTCHRHVPIGEGMAVQTVAVLYRQPGCNVCGVCIASGDPVTKVR